MRRKVELVTGQYYHVFNKSIEGFKILNGERDFERMTSLIRYYQYDDLPGSFTFFCKRETVRVKGVDASISLLPRNNKIVEIIAYCLMPTHVHFVLRQIKDEGIATFMRLLQNSFAVHLNKKVKRKGPLWAGRFKNVFVESDEQLVHLTRYVHLNPSSAGIVDAPGDWPYSSYREYLGLVEESETISVKSNAGDMTPADYKDFVEGWIKSQREISLIKHLALE